MKRVRERQRRYTITCTKERTLVTCPGTSTENVMVYKDWHASTVIVRLGASFHERCQWNTEAQASDFAWRGIFTRLCQWPHKQTVEWYNKCNIFCFFYRQFVKYCAHIQLAYKLIFLYCNLPIFRFFCTWHHCITVGQIQSCALLWYTTLECFSCSLYTYTVCPNKCLFKCEGTSPQNKPLHSYKKENFSN